MKRIEQRIFRLGDEIAKLAEEERLAREELILHQHIDDDARRDAVVSESPMDRADARETSHDVSRAQRIVDRLAQRRERLEEKRGDLIARLGE